MIRVLIAPQKYVQGPHALKEAEEYIKKLGSRALIISDPFVRGIASDNLVANLKEIEAKIEDFRGECTKKEIIRLQEIADEYKADLIIGIGGGKTLDTSKAVADALKLALVCIPTVAATDAPCSAVSVIYSENGEVEEYRFFNKNPDVVLVDSWVVAQSPVRFLVSGMGDTIPTWLEAEASNKRHLTAMSGGIPTTSAMILAKASFDIVLQYGLMAKEAVERKVITPAVEKIIEANTLMSGIGFESGGLAAAHSIHNGLCALEETHEFFHGEKVAFSAIVQLIMEDRTHEEIFEIIDFCQSVGLPTTLADLNLGETSEKQIRKIGEVATSSSFETIFNMPFPVDADMIYNAIITADALGKLRKNI